MSEERCSDIQPSGIWHAKRNDIQVLRAIAVLLVLFYHAGAALVPRGYLGVDIFFVISGFLVTRMIVGDLDRDRFSFLDFYARRARRLLPAAYCTFAVTLIAAAFFLVGEHYTAFLKQLGGALTFTANLVLWQQAGYFDTAAELKPLLHTWSLSIEEQYYLLLPLFLVLVARRRFAATALLFALSLGLYLYAATRHPDAAFYLLPTRAWELLIGSLCAMAARERIDFPRPVLALSLFTLLLVPTVGVGSMQLGLDAILVTSATAVLIMGRYRALDVSAVSTRLGVIGDWSYSIYLVHWPLFAFAAHAYVGQEVPAPVRYGLAAASISLAYVQYRFVESRFTGKTTSAAAVLRAAVAASALMLASIPLAMFMHGGATSTAHASNVLKPNYGLDKRCDFDKSPFKEDSACMTSPQPEYAVWGDSFAMHLMHGLARSEIRGSLIQLTKSACAPILGVAFIQLGTRNDRQWARSCIEFNDSVYEYLKARPFVRVVILSSPFKYFAETTLHLRRDEVHPAERAALVTAFTATVEALRSAGKKVIIVAPMPGAGFDVRSCLERLDRGAVILGRDGCDFPEETYTTRRADALAFLRAVQPVAPVLWPHELLCQGGTCRARINGKSVYNDGSGHLSPEGSIAFAEQFKLADKIRLSAK